MLLAIYLVAYIMALLGLVLHVGSRLNPHVSRSMIVVGIITALVTACLYTF